jgi:hypothetical protein
MTEVKAAGQVLSGEGSEQTLGASLGLVYLLVAFGK